MINSYKNEIDLLNSKYFSMKFIHKPVMADQIIAILRENFFSTDKISILDVTAGEGGHTERFLMEFPESQVVFSDRDQEMLDRASSRVSSFSDRAISLHSNFSNVSGNLAKENLPTEFDIILADLGISMYHILESGRGFSFKLEEDLDMRLDQNGKSAADIVNHYPEKDLLRIFYEFGEERWSKRIVERLLEARRKQKFRKTAEVATLVENAIPRKFWPPGRHPSFRIFQALRIEVNQELEHIKNGVRELAALLKPGGYLLMISFHSLEDRIVKHSMRDVTGDYEILTKKPVLPSAEEIADNISARSAKLRILRRKNG